jgi:hypothetical protein
VESWEIESHTRCLQGSVASLGTWPPVFTNIVCSRNVNIYVFVNIRNSQIAKVGKPRFELGLPGYQPGVLTILLNPQCWPYEDRTRDLLVMSELLLPLS